MADCDLPALPDGVAVGQSGQDIMILFNRIWQLEARQVSSRKDLEAKIHSFKERVDEELKSLRGRSLTLEAKDEVQDALLEDLNPARLRAEERLELLEGRCGDLEAVAKGQRDHNAKVENGLAPVPALAAQLAELRGDLDGRCGEIQDALAAHKELVERCEERVAEANQKTENAKMTINFLTRASQQHGITPDTMNVSERVDLVEATLNIMTRRLDGLKSEAEGSAAFLKDGVAKLTAETMDLSAKFGNHRDELERRMYKAEQRHESLVSFTQRLQEEMEDGDFMSHLLPEPDSLGEAVNPVRMDTGELNRDLSSTPTGLSRPGSLSRQVSGTQRGKMKMMATQQLEQLKELLEWRCQVTEELRRLTRLGRIMEDRLEALDMIERRTEAVAEQVQALGSEADAARSRSASPLPAAFRPRPEENPDLTLDGTGHGRSRVEKPSSRISSPNFEGTGWAKELPRRPFSAGAARGADISQLQHLRDQLAHLSGLPLDLQKKLQASPGQSVFPSRPPSAGAAIALCRPQRPNTGPGRRPMSAR